MKTVMVTGAAGFIGSHLAKRLENEGYKVKLVDDFSRGSDSYLRYLKIKNPCIRMDLRDTVTYNKGYFEDVDEVYHCACRIGNNEYLHGSLDKKLHALQDNVSIDTNVFRICRELNIKKVIYTSSVSIYNMHQQNSEEAVFSESDVDFDGDIDKYRIDPEGGYGWAKFLGELQLNWLSKNDTNVGVVRIFKSYGPCDDYMDKSGQVVTSLMRKAIIYPDEKFVLWNDGSVTRCLVYIDDLIDGIMKLSDYCNDKSLTVNMGGNRPYRIRELANKIISLSGKKIEVENDMSKLAGAKSRIPILRRAKEKLDWEPTTSLEEGLKKTYKWMEHELTRS